MIEVRNFAEAAAYAWLSGHAVIEKRRPRPGVEVWECAWRDQLRELVFVENPAAAPPLSPGQFEQVGREVLATLPDAPLGFVRGEAKRVFEDALLAGACLVAAGAELPGNPLAPLLAQANARRSAVVRALSTLPEALPVDAIPLPPHGFVPGPAEAAWLATAAPFPVEHLPGPWQVVARGPDGRFLLRHPDHALAWATVAQSPEGRRIVALVPLSGRAALAALLAHGFRLEEVQKARLRAVARAGAADPDDPRSPVVLPRIDDVLRLGLGEGRARAILELRHPSHRLRLVEVETRDPRFKSALVAFFLDASDAVLGLRIIEGVDGYEMMRLADALAPALPGVDGSAPEAEHVAVANAEIERIAASVEPVIAAMLAGQAGIEAVRPRPGDAARVFVAAEAEAVERTYAALWERDPPRLRARASEVSLVIRVCPAGFFGTDNPLARGFPAGYARIAARLNPAVTWVCWDVNTPGHSQAFDGLAWVGDRWAWFPSPHKVLGA